MPNDADNNTLSANLAGMHNPHVSPAQRAQCADALGDFLRATTRAFDPNGTGARPEHIAYLAELMLGAAVALLVRNGLSREDALLRCAGHLAGKVEVGSDTARPGAVSDPSSAADTSIEGAPV